MRILLLPGPSKTATTHVQSFISENAAFFHENGWLWPPCPHSLGHASSGGFANFLKAVIGEDCDAQTCISPRDPCTSKYVEGDAASVRSFYKKVLSDASDASAGGTDVVIGAEHFSAVGGPLGPRIFEGLREILPFDGRLMPEKAEEGDGLETVVVVRFPRAAQLRSIFSQHASVPKGRPILFDGSFAEWLCSYFSMSRITPNPLRLAAAFLDEGVKVTVVEMGAVGRDIADSIACEVMGLPCSMGMVDGIAGDRGRHNVRNNSTMGTDGYFDEALENILEAMDCFYYDAFVKNVQSNGNNIKIVHQYRLFKNNCEGVFPIDQETAYAAMKNLGCGFNANKSVKKVTTVSKSLSEADSSLQTTLIAYLVVGNIFVLGLMLKSFKSRTSCRVQGMIFPSRSR
mmetsp:Transcript_33689/g.77733  ORF Transcript_33689/g.77733 Transcript_33689/m.77733 type:complete len:401 (-) Transcript_33689:525-1727(-)